MDRKDPLMAHLLKNVETLFQPKSVCSDGDWLVTQQEPGQTFQTYQQGGPQINFTTATQKTIYLFFIDDSIDEPSGELFKAYCEAFFLGCPVRLVRPGQAIKAEPPANKVMAARARAAAQNSSTNQIRKKVLPKNFITKERVATRANPFSGHE